MRYSNSDLTTRQMLEAMRRASAEAFKRHLNEDYESSDNDNTGNQDDDDEDEDENGYKPITNDKNRFGNNTLDEIKNEVMHSINANIKWPKDCLKYSSKKRDIVLVGTIVDLNNLHFKFSYNDNSGCGCYIWNNYSGGADDEVVVSSDNGDNSGKLQLTDANLRKISLIAAAYQNWKDKWIQDSSLLFK